MLGRRRGGRGTPGAGERRLGPLRRDVAVVCSSLTGIAGIGSDGRREREVLELGHPAAPLLRRGGGSNVVSGPVAATVGGATGPAAGHHSAWYDGLLVVD